MNTISSRSEGLRVLLVEDQADSAASMATLLRMNGHEVRVALDGPAALDEAQAVAPDVVLLDLGVPGGMDGFEVAERLQEQNVEKKPLLVAVTGWGQQEDKRQSQDAGFNCHMVKPVDPAALEKLLAGLDTATA